MILWKRMCWTVNKLIQSIVLIMWEIGLRKLKNLLHWRIVMLMLWELIIPLIKWIQVLITRIIQLFLLRKESLMTSAVEAGKVEKSLSSVSLNRVAVKRVKPDQDVEHNGNVVNRTISEIAGSQSPFRTPPSLSYCHDKLANALSCDGVSDEPGLRQHRAETLSSRTCQFMLFRFSDGFGHC